MPENAIRDEPVFEWMRSCVREWWPQLADLSFTHARGGYLGVPRDWLPTVGFDRDSRIATSTAIPAAACRRVRCAPGFSPGSSESWTTGLEALPVHRPRAPRWEIEPFRWIGVRYVQNAFARIDEAESAQRRRRSTPALPNISANNERARRGGRRALCQRPKWVSISQHLADLSQLPARGDASHILHKKRGPGGDAERCVNREMITGSKDIMRKTTTYMTGLSAIAIVPSLLVAPPAAAQEASDTSNDAAIANPVALKCCRLAHDVFAPYYHSRFARSASGPRFLSQM